jgi:hypothetical protein
MREFNVSDPNIEPDIIKPLDSSRTAVLLPCEPDQFRDFIAGLLGKPQVIGRVIRGPFNVGRNDIENLYHLIDQRISSQNDATLIQFTARIVFDDSSSVLLNSFADFVSYKEVKPLVSKSVNLSWTYLIKFRNKSVFEKQQIDVSCIADYSREDIFHDFDVSGLVFKRQFGPASESGNIILRISHTDRTWGTDIEALLTGHLQTLILVDSKFRQFVRKYSGSIGLIGAATVFGSVVYAGWGAFDRIQEHATVEARTLLAAGSTNAEQIAKMIRTILQYTIENPSEKYKGAAFVAGTVLFIGCVAFGVMLGVFAESSKSSFVVLTSKAEELRKIELNNDRNNWSNFVLSIVGALVISVVGNYLFFLVLKHYLQ